MLDYARMQWAVVLRTPAFRAFLVRLPYSSAILAAYWIILFVATHLPARVARGARLPSDKLLHLSAYAVLAILMAWTVGATARLSFRWLVAMLLLIAAYGAMDELTQMLVPSRTADLADWYADVAGAGAGLALYAFVDVARPRR